MQLTSCWTTPLIPLPYLIASMLQQCQWHFISEVYASTEEGFLCCPSLGWTAAFTVFGLCRGAAVSSRCQKRADCHEDALKDHEAWRFVFFSPTMWMCFFLFCSKGGKWATFNRGDGKDGSKRAFWRTTLHHVVDGFGFLTFLYVHTCLGRHSQLSWKKLAWAESSTGLSGLSFLHFRWISFPVAYITC